MKLTRAMLVNNSVKMNSSQSEYNKNFIWFHNKSSPPHPHFGSANLKCWRRDLEEDNSSSFMDHKTMAKQYLKLNPTLDRTSLRKEKKTEYELSLSTYQDSFRKNTCYPSMEDYVKVADTVASNYLPESVKCYYQSEDRGEGDVFGGISFKSHDVMIHEPSKETSNMEEKLKWSEKTPRRSSDCVLPPKITDMGAFVYRNDISHGSVPKRVETDDEYIDKTTKKITKFLMMQELPTKKKKKDEDRKPKRYTNSRVF